MKEKREAKTQVNCEMTGRRVGKVKERERRNKLAVAPMSDHGNRRDWLKFDHGPRELRSPCRSHRDLTHS
jgi:hypothetical protein